MLYCSVLHSVYEALYCHAVLGPLLLKYDKTDPWIANIGCWINVCTPYNPKPPHNPAHKSENRVEGSPPWPYVF